MKFDVKTDQTVQEDSISATSLGVAIGRALIGRLKKKSLYQ